jgi:hypothetical protein
VEAVARIQESNQDPRIEKDLLAQGASRP